MELEVGLKHLHELISMDHSYRNHHNWFYLNLGHRTLQDCSCSKEFSSSKYHFLPGPSLLHGLQWLPLLTTPSSFSRPYLQSQGILSIQPQLLFFPRVYLPSLLPLGKASSLSLNTTCEFSSHVTQYAHIFLSMLLLKAQHKFVPLQETFHSSPAHIGLGLCHRESDNVCRILFCFGFVFANKPSEFSSLSQYVLQ